MGRRLDEDGPVAPGRYAYDLDRVLHEKARLGILTSLLAHPRGLLFRELKDLCALTDGNLSRHLQALHETGLVETIKDRAASRRARTLCRITPEGRRRFASYLAVLEGVIGDAREATAGEPGPTREADPDPDLPPGWVPA